MTSTDGKENSIEICNEISRSLKNQNIFILDKSAVKINAKEVDPLKYILDDDTVNLEKGNQTSWKNLLIPKELNFGLSNPYFKFCQKPDDSNINPHLEISRKSEKLHKGSPSSSNGEESKQALSIFKIQPNILPASLLNGVKYTTNSNEENAKIGEKNPRDYIYLNKSTDKDSNKRNHEIGVFDSSILEECDATRKKTLFTKEEESFKGNPYYEYIQKLEESNSEAKEPNYDIYTNGNSEEHNAKKLASDEEKKGEKCLKRIENGGDIFGNNFTSKNRNNFKVICPHCSRKVSAPGYVRHLTYCMKVGIRKRTRKS